MTYTPMLVIHIAGGMIAVLAGSIALVVRKGSLMHRRTGDVFVIAMLFMASGGAYIAMRKSQPFNVFAGTLTFYLVATAALVVMRKPKQNGRLEFAFMLIALVAGITALVFALREHHKGSIIGYSVFATIALLCAAGDLRMLIRGGVAGVQRMVRHIWRMGFALFVAAGSFFLGTASDPVMRRSGLRATLFTKEIRATHLPQVPVIIIVVLTIFWLIRVRYASAYKTPRTPRLEKV
ncbi:MAG TPA: DUF2306 domain-containing protein [Thermoanaerobaculia bacterium]|jgi:hypothetical protein|nr:DUF2306 domain-containing protein [Thermoanaerobaculia bacterium]